MFERFTDRARRVVVLASEEARLLGHGHIGTEHVLLGLVDEGEGVAARALAAMGLTLERARAEVTSAVGQGAGAPEGHIPFTPRAKKVLELSLREALQLGHNYIGTEHILLGLIREGDGVGARVLVTLGADLPGVRRRVLDLLRDDVTLRDVAVGRPGGGRMALVAGVSPAGRAPAEPVRVVPLTGEGAARGDRWRLALLSLEIWTDWVDLRYALLPEPEGRLPADGPGWRLSDDAGTDYRQAGGASGGDDLLEVHQIRFEPAPPSAATTLTLTAVDRSGVELAGFDVPLEAAATSG